MQQSSIMPMTVICCRGTGEEALTALQSRLHNLRLTLNEAKTRLCHVPDESVDFLGYTIGRCCSPRTGGAYIGTRPSRKSVERICRQVSELTGRRWVLLDAATEVRRINREPEPGLLEGRRFRRHEDRERASLTATGALPTLDSRWGLV